MHFKHLRKIKLFIASSLDGYISREDGDIGWLFTDADYGYLKFYNSIDTVLMGRRTYDKALEFNKYPFKNKKSYIFSKNRLAKTKDRDVEFISDIIEFVKHILKMKGKDIWLVGGSDIISIFLNANLIDEVILSIHPIILGKGIPLFKNIHRQLDLKLINSGSYTSGLIQSHYEVKKKVSSESYFKDGSSQIS
jgi:dihydrofolate reductase